MLYFVKYRCVDNVSTHPSPPAQRGVRLGFVVVTGDTDVCSCIEQLLFHSERMW